MYLVIALLNVAISIPLAMRFAGFGAALGTAVGTFLGQIMFMNWYYWKKAGLDIPAYWKKILSIALRSIPVFAVFYLTDRLIPLRDWVGLITKGVVSLVIAAPYYYGVILEQEERDLIRRILRLR